MIAFEQTQQDVVEIKTEIKELKALLYQKVEAQIQTDDPLFIDGVERLSGYSKPTIYGFCQKNTIPHHKKNGRLFFFKSEIIDWIKEGKQKTINEIEADTDILFQKKSKSF
ncbi:helix-turn-helix domain-containing protein [Cellulophaga sp. L1A9]|uniref:helix-turn-helix domain-containing protein n=1 Tax=Cellulophaga sp. L1A9 TaxID=2686362 RepID=UPI00131CC874|nr:helix-turn-helix domain-containing protein [Cellulophaga sp. L1A9]